MGLERVRGFIGLVGHGRGWGGCWRHGKRLCGILNIILKLLLFRFILNNNIIILNTPLGHTIPDTPM